MIELLSLITILVIAGALYLLIRNVSSPQKIGKAGEYDVARILKRLNKRDYIVYHDIYLESKGYTSQIDHVVLSVYGIFVIETKRHKGWIFGNDRAQYWTQTLYKKKFKIYNPVIQNWAHVNFMKRISPELKHAMYFPIVVFAGQARLKKIEASVPVILKSELLRCIKRAQEVYITHEQLAVIDRQFCQSLVSDKNIQKEHVANVTRHIQRKKSNNITSEVCPKCGGKTVIKHGQYGQFHGCTNYPTCKFTRSVN